MSSKGRKCSHNIKIHPSNFMDQRLKHQPIGEKNRWKITDPSSTINFRSNQLRRWKGTSPQRNRQNKFCTTSYNTIPFISKTFKVAHFHAWIHTDPSNKKSHYFSIRLLRINMLNPIAQYHEALNTNHPKPYTWSKCAHKHTDHSHVTHWNSNSTFPVK